MIDEQMGLKRGLQFFSRPSVIGAPASRACAPSLRRLPRTRMMDEVVIECRHQIKIGDALGGDQSKRFADIEAAQADEGAADERHGQSERTPMV